jgi:hypothetical protein
MKLKLQLAIDPLQYYEPMNGNANSEYLDSARKVSGLTPVRIAALDARRAELPCRLTKRRNNLINGLAVQSAVQLLNLVEGWTLKLFHARSAA